MLRAAGLVLWAMLAARAEAGIAETVREVVAQKVLQRAKVGVTVLELADSGPRVIFEHNSRTPLTPASNMKLVTTSAALAVLGPDFHFQTYLIRHGEDLAIWADGDPTLGDAELMARINWDMLSVYQDWAEQLKKRGITTLRNLYVDDSIFDQQFLHPRWDKHRFELFGAEIGGLNFNLNSLEFHVQASGRGTTWSTRPQTSYITVTANNVTPGSRNVLSIPRPPDGNTVSLSGSVAPKAQASITIHDPPMYAATVAAETLLNSGIRITGGIGRDRDSRRRYAAADAASRARDWQAIALFRTPLTTVITRANKDSQNLYTECLSKRIGAATSGQSGSWANGTAAAGKFLQSLGVATSEFSLDDGSGLSRENRISSHALARVLAKSFNSPYRDHYIESLAVGGVDGTLKRRFGPLAGRVHAKTGFIANVSALSGYLQARDGKWYAFSILMDGIPDLSNSAVKPLQEEIVKAIDEQARPAK